MVDLITAYNIVDKSILNVANDMVTTETIDFKEEVIPYRLQEIPINLAERNTRIKAVVVAHDLRQYVQKFYSISMKSSEKCLIDILVDLDDDMIDVSEFGGDICY